MKTLIATFALALSFVPAAHADYVDDQIIKAEKRVASAEANLIKWRDCATNRETCLAELREKAEATLKRAQDRAMALK